jgi:DNA-binding CsgD family transcriptional regulator
MSAVPMVGRAGELSELVEAWDNGLTRLGAGTPAGPRTAVLTGAAGCGKSLLVTAALAAFDPAARTVLAGGARVHTPAPYDWLAAVLSAHDTGDLPVPADALTWLAQQPGQSAQRYAPAALLRLAVKAVRALVGTGPAVIIAEDLHALDPASLNLLAEVAGAPGLPALLLVTSRPAEEALSPELAARTLARLAGTPNAIRVHLGSLGEAEVGSLLERAYGVPVPDEVVGAIRIRTGGNPYALTELLAAARRPEDLVRQVGPGVTGLTAREREVLSCLAAGMSNKQVARSLGISIRTVAVHVSNLLRKTRSASRTEAALWAVRHRLGDPSGIT